LPQQTQGPARDCETTYRLVGSLCYNAFCAPGTPSPGRSAHGLREIL